MEEVLAINVNDAREDTGWIAPVSPSLDHLATNPVLAQQVKIFRSSLLPAGPPLPWTFAVLNAAALVDLGRGDYEAEAAYVALELLCKDPRREALILAAGAIALGRDGMIPEIFSPALDLTSTTNTTEIHARMELLARKLLIRQLHSMPPP